jgi:hypothetical protein
MNGCICGLASILLIPLHEERKADGILRAEWEDMSRLANRVDSARQL